MDDNAQIKAFLDGLYAQAVQASQRGPALTAAVLRVIDDKARADAAFEQAFGHLLPTDPPARLHAAPQAMPPGVAPLRHDDRVGAQPHVNPILVEALRRDGT